MRLNPYNSCSSELQRCVAFPSCSCVLQFLSLHELLFSLWPAPLWKWSLVWQPMEGEMFCDIMWVGWYTERPGYMRAYIVYYLLYIVYVGLHNYVGLGGTPHIGAGNMYCIVCINCVHLCTVFVHVKCFVICRLCVTVKHEYSLQKLLDSLYPFWSTVDCPERCLLL